MKRGEKNKAGKNIQETIHKTQLLFKSIPVPARSFEGGYANRISISNEWMNGKIVFVTCEKACLYCSIPGTLKNAQTAVFCLRRTTSTAMKERFLPRSTNIPGIPMRCFLQSGGGKAIKTYRKCKIHVPHKSAKSGSGPKGWFVNSYSRKFYGVLFFEIILRSHLLIHPLVNVYLHASCGCIMCE